MHSQALNGATQPRRNRLHFHGKKWWWRWSSRQLLLLLLPLPLLALPLVLVLVLVLVADVVAACASVFLLSPRETLRGR
jgi:hypothetical protein